MEQSLPPNVDRLIEQLKSPDACQRISAAAGLAGLDCRDESVRRALEIVARNDPDEFVQVEARFALGQLGYAIPTQTVESQKVSEYDKRLNDIFPKDTEPSKSIPTLLVLLIGAVLVAGIGLSGWAIDAILYGPDYEELKGFRDIPIHLLAAAPGILALWFISTIASRLGRPLDKMAKKHKWFFWPLMIAYFSLSYWIYFSILAKFGIYIEPEEMWVW